MIFFSGCSILPINESSPSIQITTAEVVKLCSSGKSTEEVIQTIKQTQSIFHLKSRDVVDLKENGVPYEIIDYMLETEREEYSAEEQFKWRSYYYHYYNDPWYQNYYN